MKLIGYAVAILVVIGIVKGTIDLGDGSQSVADIAGSILGGIRDTTVMLIPKLISWVTSLVDQIPDAKELPPPA